MPFIGLQTISLTGSCRIGRLSADGNHNIHVPCLSLVDLMREAGSMIREWALGSAITRLRSFVETAMLLLTSAREIKRRAEMERRGQTVVVECYRIQITLKDILTLEMDKWLNDNIINFYLQVGCSYSKRV